MVDLGNLRDVCLSRDRMMRSVNRMRNFFINVVGFGCLGRSARLEYPLVHNSASYLQLHNLCGRNAKRKLVNISQNHPSVLNYVVAIDVVDRIVRGVDVRVAILERGLEYE